MPLVEIDTVDDSLDGLIERSVFEDDVGRLPSQFKGQSLLRPGQGALDALADFRRTGEGDLVDIGVGGQGRAGRAGAGDDVDDTGRKVRLADDLGQEERGERRRLGRLEDDGVAGCQGGGELPRRHQQREVPRNDLPGHADRRHVAVGESVFELVGPAGVVEEMRRGEGDVDVARLLDRLAAVHGLDNRQHARLLLDQAGDAEDVLGALARCQLPPHLLIRAPRFLHGPVDVFGIGVGHMGQRLFRGRIDRLEPAFGVRLDELSADEEVVLRLQPGVVGRFQRRRVVPQHR